MYDQILLDLGKGAFFKAFLALLIFGGGLAAQGKLTPMLAKLSPWGRTIAILVGVQAGQAALSLDAGVAWTLAVGRALPPIAILLVAHYFPSPAAPPADAAPAAPAGPSAAAKVAAKVGAALGMVLFVLGLSALATGSVACTKAQMQEVKTVETVVEKVLSDGDRVCVAAEAMMGVSTPEAVRIACGIDELAEKALEAELAIQNQAVALMVRKSMAMGARVPPDCGAKQ